MTARKASRKSAVKSVGVQSGDQDRVRPSCGAVALAHICGKLGVVVTPGEIAADSDDGVDTASMSGLGSAATQRGLKAQPGQWSIADLKQNGAGVSGRMLMHFPAGGGHWVVFDSFDGESCLMTDPTTVRVRIDLSLEKLERWWSGKVLVIGRK